ncbi:MAG TPA: CPBP family glutamic-type intramembrane protease [Anaerolineales bacterium]|nr:CPBP family glutamic-type intramembrane protease [Anaerolineales bacterium]
MNASQTGIKQNRYRQFLILASPIFIVTLGHFAACLFLYLFDDWAWLGSSLVYWGSMILIIWLLGDRRSLSLWFGKSQGSKWWIALGLAMGLISFPLLFFPNIHVMKPIGLIVAWFLFAMINSTCEEAYWRGFLLDETSHMPRAFGVIYSTIFFTAIHPLMLGVFSRINAYDPAHPTALIPFWIILVILSLSFSLLYLKTKSLRLPILSHFLSDLGNLSIFLFMNMITI